MPTLTIWNPSLFQTELGIKLEERHFSDRAFCTHIRLLFDKFRVVAIYISLRKGTLTQSAWASVTTHRRKKPSRRAIRLIWNNLLPVENIRFAKNCWRRIVLSPRASPPNNIKVSRTEGILFGFFASANQVWVGWNQGNLRQQHPISSSIDAIVLGVNVVHSG